MARMAVWALLLLLAAAWTWSGVEAQGYWNVVVQNAGISSMHSAVTHYGNVVLLDRTNIGPSQLPLPPGVCRNNPLDRVYTSLLSCSIRSPALVVISFHGARLQASPLLKILALNLRIVYRIVVLNREFGDGQEFINLFVSVRSRIITFVPPIFRRRIFLFVSVCGITDDY